MQSSSSNPAGQQSTAKKLFGRRRPLYAVLGGGKVADVILWRNKRLSAGILAVVTAIWLLFEVAEYHLLTLLSRMAAVAMLVTFIWSSGAALLGLSPPEIPKARLFSQRAFQEFVATLYSKLCQFGSILHGIALGKDLKVLLMTIASLWILSAIGSCCSFLTFLYFVFLCIQTLPALYERHEQPVDDLAAKASRDLEELFTKLDQQVLKKIPRGPVGERK